jgi:hypothetical protein
VRVSGFGSTSPSGRAWYPYSMRRMAKRPPQPEVLPARLPRLMTSHLYRSFRGGGMFATVHGPPSRWRFA